MKVGLLVVAWEMVLVSNGRGNLEPTWCPVFHETSYLPTVCNQLLTKRGKQILSKPFFFST